MKRVLNSAPEVPVAVGAVVLVLEVGISPSVLATPPRRDEASAQTERIPVTIEERFAEFDGSRNCDWFVRSKLRDGYKRVAME